MRLFEAAALFGAAIAAWAGAPADAATMRATWTGTVFRAEANSIGAFGIEGAAGLVGQAAEFTFIYDPDRPGSVRTTDRFADWSRGPYEDEDGNIFGTLSPILSASVKINGYTNGFSPSYGLVANYGLGESPVTTVTQYAAIPRVMSISASGNDPASRLLPARSLTEEVLLHDDPDDDWSYFSASFLLGSLSTGSPPPLVYLNADIREVRIERVDHPAPVPLPPAIALMAAGAAAIGALRLRRSPAA